MKRFSLIYNTSARHEQHEWDTSDTSATWMLHKTKRVWHECYTNDTSATRLKNVDFDNDPSENMFLYSFIYYIVRERLQREEQFHSKNYLLEMPPIHAKRSLKSAPQNLNLVMGKATSKTYPMSLHVSAWLRIVTQPRFWQKLFYVKLPTFFLARTIEN